MSERADCVVIGAGIVGLAVGRALALSGREVLLLESQNAVGTGISSRNSEVIHAGLYYPAQSLKATFCVAGRQAIYQYCNRRQILYRRLGKIIIATSDAETAQLYKYAAQAAANGVSDIRHLCAEEVKQLEPAVHCTAGLLSPSTGIVDSHGLMLAFQADIEANKGLVVLNTYVTGGELGHSEINLELSDGLFVQARTVINAAGLHAQELSRRLKGLPSHKIPPLFLAKGHYFSLAGPSPFHRLVYPIANTAGLGVHVTLDLAGRVRFGPDVEWVDDIDYSFDENRRKTFVDAIKVYYPSLDEAKLAPAYVGIRPKIVGKDQAPADFLICGPEEHNGSSYIALYGIESPGLTASLELANHVCRILMPS